MHDLQRRLHELRRSGVVSDVLLLLEHEPVITLGRNAATEHVLLGAEQRLARGVELVRTDRGGDVTYHGPGQLVCYPIIDLKPDRCDLRHFVGCLAEAMIAIARRFGVDAAVADSMVGVWADAAQPQRWPGRTNARELVKIGAIGVRLSRWVSMHGFALNLSTALDAFSMIVPCGLRDFPVASVASLTGETLPSVAEIALSSGAALEKALDRELSNIEDLASAGTAELAERLSKPVSS